MADYYPLLARAVQALSKNTPEARRTVYERSRQALMAQLSAMPSVREDDLARERLSLEEAIRRIEAEADESQRIITQMDAAEAAKNQPNTQDQQPQHATEAAEPDADTPSTAQETGKKGKRSGKRSDSTDKANSSEIPPQSERLAVDVKQDDEPVIEKADPPASEESPEPQPPQTVLGDVIEELQALGNVTSEAARSAKETAFGEQAAKEFPRIEPSADAGTSLFQTDFETKDESIVPIAEDALAPRQDDKRKKRFSLVASIVGLGLAMIIGALALILKDRTPVALQGTPQPETTTSNKVGDRLNAESAAKSAASKPSTSPAAKEPTKPGIAVAQRAVLYEEAPDTPEKGRAFVGRVVWRMETVNAPAGQTPQQIIRADVEIPDRKLQLAFTIRRNTDTALPASHTLEMQFTIPSDLPSAGIANVPGVLTKASEGARGAPLAGLSVRVTSGYFLVGLSTTASDRSINERQLKEHGWFDIPILYNNGRRALLTLEKGNSGDALLLDAFKVWQ